MQNISSSFTIKVNKSIYTQNYTSVEDFFKDLVIKHVASDYDFIVTLAKKQLKKEENKKYEPYLATLKDIKQSIEESIVFSLTHEDDTMQEYNVKFNFNYYPNTIADAEKTVQTELFTRNIKSSSFMAKDMQRVGGIFSMPQEKIDSLIVMYTHVEDLLEEAQESITVNEAIIAKSFSPTIQ